MKTKLKYFLKKNLNKIAKPQLTTIIETRIDNKKNKIFYGESLVANFLQHMYANFNQNSANYVDPPAFFLNRTSVKLTNNTNSGSVIGNVPTMNAGSGILTSGIILGTGNTAPTPQDFSIQTLIASGNGAGQLLYGAAQGIQGTTIIGNNTQFTINRTFSNNSGAAITVNEIAVYISSAGQAVCIYRDLVAGGDTINSGQVYDVLITFNITT